jgi:hypothetical protein
VTVENEYMDPEFKQSLRQMTVGRREQQLESGEKQLGKILSQITNHV